MRSKLVDGWRTCTNTLHNIRRLIVLEIVESLILMKHDILKKCILSAKSSESPEVCKKKKKKWDKMTELGISEIVEFRKCETIAFWENIIVCVKKVHSHSLQEKKTLKINNNNSLNKLKLEIKQFHENETKKIKL